MDDEKIKARIGSNIASFRKAAGLTQAGLAEKLNYSDKAISKWERGESVPDVLTLMQLGQLFGVTMDALVSSDSPAGAGLQEPERPTARKGIIQALVSTLVWFVALFFFVVISSFRILGGLCLCHSRQRHCSSEPALRLGHVQLEPGADLRHRLGQPDQPVYFPAGLHPRKRMEAVFAGHSRTNCHFPMVPDVPQTGPEGSRAGGNARW